MITLYIDSFGNNLIPNLITISNIEEIRELYNNYFSLEVPIPLSLDIRSLSNKAVSVLLKFLEEYQEDIILIAQDPVLPTIMSRSTLIKKYPDIPKELNINNVIYPLINKKILTFIDKV